LPGRNSASISALLKHRRARSYRLQPWIDLQPHLDGYELIKSSLGYDGALCVLAAKPPTDYREERKGGSFAKTKPSKPATFIVLRCDEQGVTRIDLPEQSWNYHHVQPLPDGAWLLVCGRSRFRGPSDYDLNGRVFSRGGVFKHALLLGDGIESVQTTGDGLIWVSYFDEGIVGSNGWQEPVGASGLICWDGSGQRMRVYQPPAGLRAIQDCYALNVASDRDTWFYYYDDFRLVHLGDGQVHAAWECPLRSLYRRFAIHDNAALIGGRHGENGQYHLLSLEDNGRAREHTTYRFLDADGKPLEDSFADARADTLVLVSKELAAYRVTLPELLAAR
jgi:hypothetical protein